MKNEGTIDDAMPWNSPGDDDEYDDPYGNGTLVPSDHWGKGCPDDCGVHHGHAGDVRSQTA